LDKRIKEDAQMFDLQVMSRLKEMFNKEDHLRALLILEGEPYIFAYSLLLE
jgi:hypothetical protein